MPAVTGAFSHLLAPGLRKVFFQHLKEREEEFSKVFNMKTSSRAYEEDLEVAGLGTMPVKTEGAGIQYTDPAQGEKKRYTHVTYGLGYRVTMEMMEDDLYGVMRKMTKELAKAARNAREVNAWNVFNTAFTTQFGFPKFGANEALISTSHTRLGGGTLSNRPSVDADLGQASLEAARIHFETLTDENGIPTIIKPKWLIVPPDMIMVARELLGSEFKPYESSNTINPIMKDGLDFMVSHYLTDPDAWFLIAGKDEHDLNFFTRQAVRYQNGDDFDTGDAKFKAFQRFSVGAGEWRGLYGSTGA